MNIFHLREIKKGVGNLISWFPIIWNDRDWDYQYIYALLYFKLSRTEKCIRLYGHSVNNEEVADSIKECIVILKRLMEEEYCTEDWDKIHEKWGEFTLVETKDGYSTFEYANVKTDEDREKYNAEVKNCCKKEESLIQEDLNSLFEIMKKNIRGWWD